MSKEEAEMQFIREKIKHKKEREKLLEKFNDQDLMQKVYDHLIPVYQEIQDRLKLR
jgi:hypothetical protein